MATIIRKRNVCSRVTLSPTQATCKQCAQLLNESTLREDTSAAGIQEANRYQTWRESATLFRKAMDQICK